MEEKLNLHIYPLQRLKVYSEPNQIEVKLKTLNVNNYLKQHEQSNIFDYQTKAINYPYMVYDSINPNILNEIKNYYGSDQLYDLIKASKHKNVENSKEGLYWHDKKYEDVVSQINEEIGASSKLGEKEKKRKKQRQKKETHENYEKKSKKLFSMDSNYDSELSSESSNDSYIYSDDSYDSNRIDQNKEFFFENEKENSYNKLKKYKTSEKIKKNIYKEKYNENIINFLYNSKEYEKGIRDDNIVVSTPNDVINTLGTFYIQKNAYMNNKYSYDINFRYKTPVLFFPTGFFNNNIQLMEVSIDKCVYDEDYDKTGCSYETIYNMTSMYNNIDNMPVNIKFDFNKKIQIIPSKLVNHDKYNLKRLPSFYSFNKKIKLAEKYNKKSGYKNKYKLDADQILAHKIQRNEVEKYQTSYNPMNRYLKIKEIKTDQNNINETVVYARNDVGLFVFYVNFYENICDNIYEKFYEGDVVQSLRGSKFASNNVGLLTSTNTDSFEIANYNIKIKKDIHLFDRLFQICPSSTTFGKCYFLGNHNSLYTYDLNSNIIDLKDLNLIENNGGNKNNRLNKKFICLCDLNDNNNILLGSKNIYIYDDRCKMITKFNTNFGLTKKIFKNRISYTTYFNSKEKNLNNTQAYNTYAEHKSRQHFNRGYTAIEKNPDYPYIIASVNASFNNIEIWDIRNQFEPIFIFPLNISEFVSIYFRYIEWIKINPNSINKSQTNNAYNLFTFSYYQNMVYIRKIIIYDNFTKYNDLGIQTYTNTPSLDHLNYKYNYNFSENDPEPVSQNMASSMETRCDTTNKTNENEKIQKIETNLKASNMFIRKNISMNHIFSYRNVKMHISDSFILDVSKYNQMQKNKMSSIKIQNEDNTINSINTDMYNIFFGLYGATSIQFAIPTLYCSKKSDSKIESNEPKLEKRNYYDEETTQMYTYFIKRKKKKKVEKKRQEIEGIKFDYIQFIFHINSAGQIFCTPLNINIKKLTTNQLQNWIPINKLYHTHTYINENVENLFSQLVNILENPNDSEGKEATSTNRKGSNSKLDSIHEDNNIKDMFNLKREKKKTRNINKIKDEMLNLNKENLYMLKNDSSIYSNISNETFAKIFNLITKNKTLVLKNNYNTIQIVKYNNQKINHEYFLKLKKLITKMDNSHAAQMSNERNQLSSLLPQNVSMRRERENEKHVEDLHDDTEKGNSIYQYNIAEFSKHIETAFIKNDNNNLRKNEITSDFIIENIKDMSINNKKGIEKKKKKKSQHNNAQILYAKDNPIELYSKNSIKKEYKNEVLKTNILNQGLYIKLNKIINTFFREGKKSTASFHYNNFFYVQTLTNLKYSAYNLNEEMIKKYINDSYPFVTYSPNFQASKIFKNKDNISNDSKLFYSDSFNLFQFILHNLKESKNFKNKNEKIIQDQKRNKKRTSQLDQIESMYLYMDETNSEKSLKNKYEMNSIVNSQNDYENFSNMGIDDRQSLDNYILSQSKEIEKNDINTTTEQTKYSTSIIKKVYDLKELLELYNEKGIVYILNAMTKLNKLQKNNNKKKKRNKNYKKLKNTFSTISKELNKYVSIKNFFFYESPICYCLYNNDYNNKMQYNTYINYYDFLLNVVLFFNNTQSVINHIKVLYPNEHSQCSHTLKKKNKSTCIEEEEEEENKNISCYENEIDIFERLREREACIIMDNNKHDELKKFKKKNILFLSKDMTYECFQHILQNEYYIPIPKYMNNKIKINEDNFLCTPITCFKNYSIAFYNKKLFDIYDSISFNNLKHFDIHTYVYNEYFNINNNNKNSLQMYVNKKETNLYNNANITGYMGGYKVDYNLVNKLKKLWPANDENYKSKENYMEMMKNLKNREKIIFHK
ncbi:conserved Plasmodium protein, unknown function [Plasmodium vinckei vinckei]|uniref:Uncharacterized protein n=1 Tax=Plasmodium vinckei vinckei TaxID=54757 RepID=A0A449BQT0_PLAVN|nr:conserved Plasmodium protein, unknown function [Plasmodium vinckei vinckei]VEV55811.1 conserved Plasmodium protein, unknown function [Plasmodium vinckei vinckei]